jgi:hypothetical protein
MYFIIFVYFCKKIIRAWILAFVGWCGRHGAGESRSFEKACRQWFPVGAQAY